jgi:hypothetical protein
MLRWEGHKRGELSTDTHLKSTKTFLTILSDKHQSMRFYPIPLDKFFLLGRV